MGFSFLNEDLKSVYFDLARAKVLEKRLKTSKMKEKFNIMKVLLDLDPDHHHTIYNELINFPPEGVKYQIPPCRDPSKNLLSSLLVRARKEIFPHIPSEKVKSWLLEVREYVHRVKFNRSLKNRLKEKIDTDLIHVCNKFAPRNMPWVMDLEIAHALTFYDRKVLLTNKKIIEKMFSSKHCKKIMPWWNASKITLENYVDISKFENKIEVVYPAIHLISNIKERENSKKSDRIKILFIGSVNNPGDFIWKGGDYAIKVFEILSKKYDVDLFIRCITPKVFKRKYKHLDNLFFIEEFLPKDELYDLYAEADISLLPSNTCPIIVVLESMLFGLPIVAIDGFGSSEMVKHGQTGFLVNPSTQVRARLTP